MWSSPTPGRPAMEPVESHSPSGPRVTLFSAAMAMRNAASPMMRAASESASMATGLGSASKNSGALCQRWAARILTSACVLRELRSSAMRRARRMGTLLRSRRLRTRSLEAMARPGRMVRPMFWPTMRWYSMAGMIATSTAPVRRASAHCDGTVEERSYVLRRGPWVKPRTSGTVLRYCTTEMRSLLTVGCAKPGNASIADAILWRVERFDVKHFSQFESYEFGGMENVEAYFVADGGADVVLHLARA